MVVVEIFAGVVIAALAVVTVFVGVVGALGVFGAIRLRRCDHCDHCDRLELRFASDPSGAHQPCHRERLSHLLAHGHARQGAQPVA